MCYFHIEVLFQKCQGNPGSNHGYGVKFTSTFFKVWGSSLELPDCALSDALNMEFVVPSREIKYI